MREIKFRAWHDGSMLSEPPTVLVEDCSINDNLDAYEGLGYILMQYTGLHDRNGKEIYEGDILATRIGKRDVFGVMAWSEKRNGWIEFKPLDKFEVIGNQYETPELLK